MKNFCYSLLLFAMGSCALGSSLQAQTADYSRRMVETHGKAWSADRQWDYVSGLVTKSILKTTTQYPDEAWSLTAYDWCKTFADNAINSDGSFKNFKKGNIDNIASGKVFFELYDRELARGTQEGADAAARYKTAADFLYNYLRNDYSRIQLAEGRGCFFHKDIYPNQMWLDGLYMGAAFYAEWQAKFAPDDDEAWSDIANQFITVHRHTYDADKKLNYHGWSADPTDKNSFWAKQDEPHLGCSSDFWGRGMGWFFASLVDVLDFMPADHPDYATLTQILQQVAEGLKARQDSQSGVWYQLLQYDDTFVGECGKKNYLEASASSMFTYAYLKALRLGLLDDSYRPMAEKAYQGLITTFVTENADKSLNLNHSCRSAGLGPASSPNRDGSASYYLCGGDVTEVSNEGKSIGPFIMASLEHELAVADAAAQSKLTADAQLTIARTADHITLTSAATDSIDAHLTFLTGGEAIASQRNVGTVTFPTDSLAAGVYMLYGTVDGRKYARKVFVVK
jgi:unsaturated rhamnogalacturonyl hydrolase